MPGSSDRPKPAAAKRKMLRLSSPSKSAMPLLIQISPSFNWNKPHKCFGLACQMWPKNTTWMLSESEGSCRVTSITSNILVLNCLHVLIDAFKTALTYAPQIKEFIFISVFLPKADL